jgi:8-oxo-dGTP pyrophosphatase MutT (NUDIX family)
MLKSFSQFENSQAQQNGAAGVAVVLQNEPKPMILLVHSTNSSWAKPKLSIPKGGIEAGEEPLEAALREMYEETGILIKPSQLEPGIQTAEVWKGTKFMYNLYYFVCKISDVSEIGIDSIRVPKTQLQAEEVDWAGFIEIDEAYEKILSSQRIILDRVR